MRQQPRILHARRSLISKVVRRCATASRLTTGVTIFSQEILQSRVVEHGIGQQALEPRVLVLKLLQPLGFRHLHAAEFGLPLVMLASLTPSLRQSSATGMPDSCSFNIAMICSSEKRSRFILSFSVRARAYFNTDKPQGTTSTTRNFARLFCAGNNLS